MRCAQHDKVTAPNIVPCTHCSAPMVPHRVCPACGFYKGKAVLKNEDYIELPESGAAIAAAEVVAAWHGNPAKDLPEQVVDFLKRVEAQFDPRYADDLQPPYPPSEQRLERDGIVRVRLTIGSDGRVKTIERLSATSDAFWRSTQRHALARWRFRPATLDGSPVESSKVMNVYFRIES